VDLHEAAAAIHCVLQYCSGGSVHRHLRSLRHGHGLAEDFGGMLTHQLCLGLSHLHERGIAHRDVKPENVLYTDASRSVVKLCDFGFAVKCGHRRLRTICGSPAYMSPELSTRESYLGPPVDLWALGCFAYEVMHGGPAFRAESLDTLQLRIKRVDHSPFRKSLSLEASRLIKMLLVADPHGRVSAADAAPLWCELVGNMSQGASPRRIHPAGRFEPK
jgi:serine/threonine protein kinase